MSLPLAFIIKELEDTPSSIIPILSSLHNQRHSLSTVSKVDLKHLTSRTLNLCRSPKPYNVWCGVNLIYVIIDNSLILSSEGSSFFSQLLKVLESPRASDPRVFKSVVDCINKLCKNIRGKPTLTREVLTPNLSSVFSFYFDKIMVDPELMMDSLRDLVQNHPTTSRPFANKIKTKLLEFISSKDFSCHPQTIRDAACSLLAVLPVVEKDGPEQHWAQDVNRITSNIAGVLNIYDSFLNLKEDDETYQLIQKLAASDENEIFSPLHLDINDPQSLLAISERLEILFSMLKAYLVCHTDYIVTVPIGKIIILLEASCSINTKFVPFRREIRGQAVKDAIQLTLVQCYDCTISLLTLLPSKYRGSIVPYLGTVFAFLESVLFLKGKRLDKDSNLIHESLIKKVLSCVNQYLSLVGHFHDHSLLTRFVEVALLLVEPREQDNIQGEQKQQQSQHSKAARKKAKKTGSTPLSDLLSHSHLFIESVPESTRAIVLDLFAIMIPRVTLPPTYYNKVIKFIMVEAVKAKDQSAYSAIPQVHQKTLVEAVLNPIPENASLLPIASTLLWDNPVINVLNNPRFPPLPKVIKPTISDEDSELESDDDTAEESKQVEDSKRAFDEDEPASKKPKIDQSLQESGTVTPGPSTAKENIFSVDSTKLTFAEPTAAVDSVKIEENKAEIEKVEDTVFEEADLDEGDASEIEIPNINMEDSDDDN
ncbi:rRNA processing/ribosome biogenesis family protein [Clavispora lusitaniae]|uniref:rRNA processing/ribosome biogenesis family protein n=1 Tax=Clavispora lusitaniae TaxID=36911 RepID=UPI00202C7D2C|nr:rRNA processing/ribosome biogenesis family protein [Clavispora lusitaniae]